jgi:hydrogenase maturation protease
MGTRVRRILVIGVGNPYRGDDAVGVVFARQFRRCARRCVTIIEQDGEPTSLMAAWEGYDAVIVADCAYAPATRRRVHRFEAHLAALPVGVFGISTHGFGVAEAVELARATNRLPSRLLVYGICGERFEHGEPLSPEAESAVEDAIAVAHEDVDTWCDETEDE